MMGLIYINKAGPNAQNEAHDIVAMQNHRFPMAFDSTPNHLAKIGPKFQPRPQKLPRKSTAASGD
jgi:hypothetical protein